MIRYAVVAAALVLSFGCGGSSSSITPPDTTTVSSPRLVKSIPIPPNFGVHDTYLRDGFAFVCAWNTGLILYDVGNGAFGGSPDAPVEVSRIVTSDDGVAGGAGVHNAWWFHNPVTGEFSKRRAGKRRQDLAPARHRRPRRSPTRSSWTGSAR